MQRTLLKKNIVTFILSTDMAKHNKLLEKFKKRVTITLLAKENKNSDALNDFAFNFNNQYDRIVCF